MTNRRLLDPTLSLPLPPATPAYNDLRKAPPQPPSIAPPTQLHYHQETLLPGSYDPDDFYLPEADDSDYDADSTTVLDSDSLASTTSFPTLPNYDDMDELDELNFSELEEGDT